MSLMNGQGAMLEQNLNQLDDEADVTLASWTNLITGDEDCHPADVLRALKHGLLRGLQLAPDNVIKSMIEDCAEGSGSESDSDDYEELDEHELPQRWRALVHEHIKHVFGQLEPGKVVWQADYGCAVVLGDPDDLSERLCLQVFALDGFTHRMPPPSLDRPDSLTPPTSDGTQLHVVVLRAWRKDDAAMQGKDLDTFITEYVVPARTAMESELGQGRGRSRRKVHHTPGYFLGAIKVALAAMKAQDAADRERVTTAVIRKLVRGDQIGGYRDVGLHTGCKKPLLGRTLVQETFGYLLRQHVQLMGALKPTAPAQLMTLFATEVARILSGVEDEQRAVSFDLQVRNATVLACKQAAAELVALHLSITAPYSPLLAFSEHVAERLDEVARVQQRACSGAVMQNLQAASYAAPEAPETDNFGSFTVQLPDAPEPTADSSAAALDERGGFGDTLACLPADFLDRPAHEVKDWIRVASESSENALSDCHARLLVIERWLRARALDGFRCPPPCTASDVDELLEKYCEILSALLEKQHKQMAVKPCLRVELVSRRVLMTWIAMCTCHGLAQQDWPELTHYALPVDEADLRHLVLSDGHDALSCVAAYVRHVREGAGKGALFDTQDLEPTCAMALSYARDHHTPGQKLRKLLQRNVEIAQERVDARWQGVQAKQETVRDLRTQLASAKEKLAAAAEKATAEGNALTAISPSGASRPQYDLQQHRWYDAINERRMSQTKVDSIQASITHESRPPPPLIQSLPKDEDSALMVLFFLHKAHAGALPDLARLCFAAQHLVRGEGSSEQDAKFAWDAHFNAQHCSDYAPRTEACCPAADPWDVSLRSTRRVPDRSELRPGNVMHYQQKEDGVWHPDGFPSMLGWQGGAAELRNATGCESACLDPFTPPSDAINSGPGCFFTEQCMAHGTCCVGVWAARPSLPGGDVHEDWDLKRGHDSRANMDQKPEGLTTEQWDAFTALRSYPCRQLSRLCAVLQDRKLPLDDTQAVWPCVRMLLYHVGAFELAMTADDASSFELRRLWTEPAVEIPALKEELSDLVTALRDAPREAFQVPLLCDIASVVDAHECSMVMRDRLIDLASHWATDLLEPELVSHIERGASQVQIAAVRAAAARAHMLTVVSFGVRLEHTALSGAQAEQLLRHAAMAQQRYLHDADSEHYAFMTALRWQATRVLCAHAGAIDPAVHADALRAAAVAVFSDASDAHTWAACTDAFGCFVSAPVNDGARFSVCVLTGEVLRNGCAAARLRDAMLHDSAYLRTFGDRNFDVDSTLWTAQAVLGRHYGFAPTTSAPHKLAIFESEALPDGSQLVLELLPEDCTWCEGLPPRLRQPYSHWLSVEYGTILLRGVKFNERDPEYIVIQDGAMHRVYRVPERMKAHHWLELRAMTASMDELVLPLANHTSAAVVLLNRLERLDCIHVMRPASEREFHRQEHTAVVLRFELPRLRLNFELHGNGRLTSAEYSGYQIAAQRPWQVSSVADMAAVTNPVLGASDPVLPPNFFSYVVLTSCDPLEPTKVLMPGGADGDLLVRPDPTETDGHLSPSVNEDRIGDAGRCLDVKIKPPEDTCLNDLPSHVFDLEPRTHALRPQSLEGALLLAFVLAASGCDVPLPTVHCTPGEQAMSLLRQSWSNEPLSAGETAKLRGVMASALHTPALHLVCERLKQDCSSLDYLHSPRREPGASAETASPTDPGEALHTSLRLSSAVVMCDAEAVVSGGLPFSHVRRTLTAAERRDVGLPGACPRANVAPSPIPAHARLDWHSLCQDPALSASPQQAASSFQQGAPSFRDFSQVYLNGLLGYPQYWSQTCLEIQRQQQQQSEPSSAVKDIAQVIDTSVLRNTKIGQHIVNDTSNSLSAFREQPQPASVEDSVLAALGSALQQLRGQVQEAQRTLRESLLRALGSLPDKTVHGHAYRALRAGNAVATPTAADLIRLTFSQGHMHAVNPFLGKKCRQQIRQRALWWQQLCVLEDKLTRCIRRCELLLNGQTAALDDSFEALTLELSNKRAWDVQQNPRWLAFEVLQGLEIREEQYFVARTLLECGKSADQNGTVMQLNMGEGKTRVILPMLVLALAGTGVVPRLNFLRELHTDAVQYLRSCLSGSLLQVKLYLLPFTRDTELPEGNVDGIVSTLRRCELEGGFLCVSREHRLSLLLKMQGLTGQQDAAMRLDRLRGALQVLCDFLDESDELLVHTFQLIYSYGQQMRLPDGDVRWDLIQALLLCMARAPLLRQYMASKPDVFRFSDHPEPGRMPEIRFVPGDALDEAMPELYRLALMALRDHTQVRWPSLGWLRNVADFDALLDCCAKGASFPEAVQRCNLHAAGCDEERLQLLMLRGLLYHGLVQHCLCSRLFVDFGFDERSLKRTKLAVPFRHCDVPSERADFKHPEVALIYTHISYYHAGLSDDQICKVYHELQALGPSRQRALWRDFFDHGVTSSTGASAPPIGEEGFESVNAIEKIDLSNGEQFEVLRKLWRHNMRVINFWLAYCMLPRATVQFPESVRATAWHLTTPSTSRPVCGFSGTNDNTLLLPLDVKFKHPAGGRTLATNGKMLTLLLQPQTCTFVALRDWSSHQADLQSAASSTCDAAGRHTGAHASLWKGLLEAVVENHAAALIDAGALLAGVDIRAAATCLAGMLLQSQTARGGTSASAQSSAQRPQGDGYQGVVFFADEWQVMNLQGVVCSKRTSPVREADAVVIFDDARCRGADMKLRPDALALLTLGPGMLRSKLMQAAGRLRQLDKRQRLMLIANDEVCIRSGCSMAPASPIKPQHILQWALQNTATFIERGLYEFSRQGLRYAQFLESGSVVEKESCGLANMYLDPITATTVSQAFNRVNCATELQRDEAAKLQCVLFEHVERFGADVRLLLGSADEECEREVEEEEEAEREAEVEVEPPRVTPLPERSWQPSMEGGLHCESVEAFVAAGITAVSSLEDTIARMVSEHEGANLLSIEWPSHVYTTDNFTYVDTERRSELASIMPFPSALLCFQDGSLVVLSEREADACDAALRRCHSHGAVSIGSGFQPRTWLLTVPYAREVLVETCRRRRSKRAQINDARRRSRSDEEAVYLHELVPLVKGPRDVAMDDPAFERLAQGVVATQLFAGETNFQDEAVLRSLVLPACHANPQVGAKRPHQRAPHQNASSALGTCKSACRELVTLRDRIQHWDGSTLDQVFRDERDRAIGTADS